VRAASAAATSGSVGRISAAGDPFVAVGADPAPVEGPDVPPAERVHATLPALQTRFLPDGGTEPIEFDVRPGRSRLTSVALTSAYDFAKGTVAVALV